MGDNSLKSGDSIEQSGMVPLNSKEATSLMIEKARQLVNQLVDYRGHDKPPFLPEEYSRLVNIRKIQETSLGDTSALLLKFHDGYVIKVNQDHSQVRQNFSCAHEIGHILFSDPKLEEYLHTIEYRTFNARKTTDLRARSREILCDAAAAELLMPELVFRKYLSTFGISISSVELLANAFKVSLQSATRRMAEVSIKPCVAILWYPWPKSKPKGLRPALRRQSREKANYMPVHNNVGLSSALYKAYQNDTIIKTWKLFKDGNTVKRLPVEAKGFGHGEKRFVISLSYSDN